MMDFDTQWRQILTQGQMSRSFSLILPDGSVASLRGIEGQGNNGSDKDAPAWSMANTYAIHSLSLPAGDFYDALGDASTEECAVEVDGTRYRIVSVTGNSVAGATVRLFLRKIAEEF